MSSNLNFKRAYAQNFICFGPEGIEINFENFGNIILVRGENLDVQPDQGGDKVSSNGIGKSSCIDILSYGLFGKCIKHPKKIKADDVINKTVGKKMLIEIEWDDYKVIRGRKPNKLELWKGDKNLSQGHDETQELIEAKLGFSFETFSNLLVFTDNNRDAFLELDTAGKRQIAENLLDLEEFKVYAEDANNFKKSTNNDVKMATKDYERLTIEVNACKARISKIEQQEKDWKTNKANEIRLLISRIKSKQEELESSDIGAAVSRYNEAQEQIELLEKEIPPKEQQLDRIKSITKEAQVALDSTRDSKHKATMSVQEAESQLRELKTEIAKQQKIIDPLEKNEGAICASCFGPIKKEHYGNVVRQAKNVIDACNPKIDRVTETITRLRASVTEFVNKITKLEGTLNVANQKQREITNTLDMIRKELGKLSSIEKPDAGSKEKVLEEQLAQLKTQAGKLKTEYEGLSPFTVLAQSAKDEFDSKTIECGTKKTEISIIEELVPYYEFWEKGFGTKGIPKYAINGVIPTLNTQIAYWLQFLIQGTINLKLDGELDETIERNPADGDPYVYHIMSGGERRRLNLSVAAAFAKVMAIAAGSMPNVLFLDEVTTNVDPQGVVGIYRMITELSKERKVFVTTHDQTLLEMLNGCDVLFLQKKNGFTTVCPQ